MKNRYYTAQHTGGLDECIKTEKQISKRTALRLIMTGIYKYYAYDERIKAHIYILSNIEHDIGLPTWIHVYEN